MVAGGKRKTTKVSKPSRMRPRSSVASAPVQKEHRVVSKNGTSAHTHTYTCEAWPSRQATVKFVEKSANDAVKPRTLSVCRDTGATPHNTQRAKPGLNTVCVHSSGQPQAEEHVS